MVWTSAAQKKGNQNSSVTHHELLIQRVEQYNLAPKLCKHCQTPIPYEKRRNQFCSQSCGAHFNNTHFFHDHHKTTKCCKQCGSPLKERKLYCSDKCKSLFLTTQSFKKRLSMGYIPHKETIRKYILKTRPYQCEECKNTLWNNVPIPLEVHHIDGNYKNNTDENLKLLCPNCHALTRNYKTKNKLPGRPKYNKRG